MRGMMQAVAVSAATLSISAWAGVQAPPGSDRPTLPDEPYEYADVELPATC